MGVEMALEQTYEMMAALEHLDHMGLQTLTVASYRVKELSVKEAVAELRGSPSMTERLFTMLTADSTAH